MNPPLVISYYTKDTPYEEEVQRLISSCRAFNIEAQIEALPSLGSWEKNCAQKATFILAKLKELQRPVLWVDADAIFKRPPDFQEFTTCDFSVRINEFLPKTHESRVISNTIFIQASLKGIKVVEEWEEECQRALSEKERPMEFWDQMALREVLDRHPELVFKPMPLAFSKIFDYDDLFISEEEVVIEHYQASRRFKRLVHAPCCNH